MIVNLQKMLPRNYSVAANKRRIELFYDVLSPYSWFAFEVLSRYKRLWNISLEMKPVLLAGIMQSSGNSPPMMIANKAMYLPVDLLRCAKYFDVPVVLDHSKNHFETIMKGSLLPNRMLVAVSQLFPDKLEAASRAMWIQLWNKSADFTEIPILMAAGAEAGFTKDQMMQLQKASMEKEIKDLLRKNTEEASAYSAFGVPTIVIHTTGEKKVFFGSDRFPVMAVEIGEKWLGPNPGSPNAHL